MRVGLVIGLLVLGCAGEAATDGAVAVVVEPPSTGGSEAGSTDTGGAMDATGGAVASTGGAVTDATGGQPPEPTGGAQEETGGAVVTGGAAGAAGSETASGGNVAGAVGGSTDAGGEGGAETTGTGGATATGGASTGGGGATGGAAPAACTYTCTTTTTDANGSTSTSTTRYTYDPCVVGLSESSRCTQTESLAMAQVCAVDREPEPLECLPLGPVGDGGAGGSAPVESTHGKWVLDGNCVRLVAAACPSEGHPHEMCTADEHQSLALNTEISEVQPCGDWSLNCDGRDWRPGLSYQGPEELEPPLVWQAGCELSAGGKNPPSCAEVLGDRSTWSPCVHGAWGIRPTGEPCDSPECLSCVPVCVD